MSIVAIFDLLSHIYCIILMFDCIIRVYNHQLYSMDLCHRHFILIEALYVSTVIIHLHAPYMQEELCQHAT